VGITTSETFEGLELYDGKLSRTVLRRGLGCKAQLLSGQRVPFNASELDSKNIGVGDNE